MAAAPPELQAPIASTSARRSVLARMQANPVAVGIRDPRQPAHPRFPRLNQDLRAEAAGGGDHRRHLIHRERHARRPLPAPIRPPLRLGPVETERDRLGAKLGPEVVLLPTPLQAEPLPVEGPGPADILGAIRHEIDRANRHRRSAAGSGFRAPGRRFPLNCPLPRSAQARAATHEALAARRLIRCHSSRAALDDAEPLPAAGKQAAGPPRSACSRKTYDNEWIAHDLRLQ